MTVNFPAVASVVRVVPTLTGWRLERNGRPYSVKGACVVDDTELPRPELEKLAAIGGNSVRTYREENAQSTLDRAHELGLSVLLGLRVDKPRHGFDLSDAKVVQAQETRLRLAVQKFKKHPALLAWGIGNEVELKRDDPRQREVIFRALNHLAMVVKKLDPDHPTVIVTAGMDEWKADQVKKWCGDVDIIGINVYSKLPDLPASLKEWEFSRPYFVTEWGPVGYWEAPHTWWDAPIEPSSSAKAEQFAKAYNKGIRGDDQHCLGSYAFLWGNKQEATATWFGLFLKSGERLAPQDVLQQAWTGAAPRIPCPSISSIVIEGDTFAPGAQIFVMVKVTSSQPIQLEWALARESDDRKSGGDAERAPEFLHEGITNLGGGKARITLPQDPGSYRIFVFARDDARGAATANVPILIKD